MMKQRLIIVLALCMAGCLSVLYAQQSYHISGLATGLDGTMVYLGERGAAPLDSTRVSDGKFLLENPLKEVKVVNLSVGNANRSIILNEKPLEVMYKVIQKELRGKVTDVPVLEVEGDSDQELLQQMNQTMMQEMYVMLAISFMAKDSLKFPADSLGVVYASAKENTRTVFDSIVDHCKDSYVSAIILKDHFTKERSCNEIDSLYGLLSDRVKQSAPGVALQQAITSLKTISVGKPAPDFTLPAPDGSSISLSSLRGKCVLLDFWASWCGPCLREVPNVKRVYEKYHSKGFEILSVSLDDKENNWTQAIAKHELTWLHVSSLKGWKCPVAKLYNVTGIPAMFLIAADGTIVSTKARGEALETAVAAQCE